MTRLQAKVRIASGSLPRAARMLVWSAHSGRKVLSHASICRANQRIREAFCFFGGDLPKEYE